MLIRIAHPRIIILALSIAVGLALSCTDARAQARAYVAGGCFWCVESDFESVDGVSEVVSGYIGGAMQNPTYRNHGQHIEGVEIRYNPNRVSYAELMHLFFRSIDPTDAGGQFCDRGHSYTTAVFVNTPEERRIAETSKAEAQRELGQRIVTPIRDAGQFWRAEDYHQDYYLGRNLVVTRFGPIRQSRAYERYREACGRDDRIKQLWGNDAPFAQGH